MDGQVVGVPAGKQRALLALLARAGPAAGLGRVCGRGAVAAGGAGGGAAQPAGDGVASAALARCRRFGVGDGGVGISPRGRGRRDRRAALRGAASVRRGRRAWGAMRRRRGGCSMTRWRCGVGRRWPTWGSSRSRRQRSRGWRSCALAALEERIDARLSEGEHALVVAELEQLSAEHPSRERLVGPADAGAVSLRPPERRAGGLHTRPAAAGRGARARAFAGAAAPAGGDPAPRPLARSRTDRVDHGQRAPRVS